MRHSHYVGICVILCVFCAFALAGKSMKMETSGNAAAIARMGALDEEERMEFLAELSKERSDIQGNLIYQLSNSESKEMKFAAAFLLGRYRMEQSVGALSEFLTLEYEHKTPWDREPLWGRRPIVEALIRIGRPAIPEMIKNIETSEDKKVRELSARVIRYVEGPEVAKFILERQIEKQSDEAKQRNLREALQYIAGLGGR